MDFNLIVSSFRHREEAAQDEIQDILKDLGDARAISNITNISGLILVYTYMNPFEVVEMFKEITRLTPWNIRHVLRLIPVESMIPTDLKSMVYAACNLAKKMNVNDSFRVTVEKRHTNLASFEVITQIANRIHNRVCLVKPDWIVLVEIVGKLTGVSVLKQNQVFSSIIEKRNRSI